MQGPEMSYGRNLKMSIYFTSVFTMQNNTVAIRTKRYLLYYSVAVFNGPIQLHIKYLYGNRSNITMNFCMKHLHYIKNQKYSDRERNC
jgi:hypothetical protein